MIEFLMEQRRDGRQMPAAQWAHDLETLPKDWGRWQGYGGEILQKSVAWSLGKASWHSLGLEKLVHTTPLVVSDVSDVSDVSLAPGRAHCDDVTL